MSRINLNNYEAFMLDYLEGNLSQQDIVALKAFAVLHPELELNFDEELVMLTNESVSFEEKQNLKVNFNDDLVIGYLENVLEGKESAQAEDLAKTNALFKHELELYRKTIITADTSIVFENKEDLKRRGAVIFFPQINFVRVAAALLLLLGIWFMVSRIIDNGSKIENEIANKTKETKKPINTTNQAQNKTEQIKPINDTENLVAKKINKQNGSGIPVLKQNITTSTISTNIPTESNEPQLADRHLIKEQPENMMDTSNTLLANTYSAEKIAPKYVIEEGIDEEPVAAKPKGKLWNMAAGIFKGLNKRGVENVNGSENNNEIFIGALTISKPN